MFMNWEAEKWRNFQKIGPTEINMAETQLARKYRGRQSNNNSSTKTIPMMEKWFGRIVPIEEYIQGPICQQDEVISNANEPTLSDPGISNK